MVFEPLSRHPPGQRLLRDGTQQGQWATLQQVRKKAGYDAKAAMPHQEALF